MDKPAGSPLSRLDALLADLAEEAKPRQPDEVTVEEQALRMGLNRQLVARKFREMLEEGKMTRRHCVIDGRRSFLWRVV